MRLLRFYISCIRAGVILLVILTTGCKGRPSGVYSEKKMQKVFFEMMQVAAYVNQHLLLTDTLYNDTLLANAYYDKVLALNNTNRKEFNKSLDYYQQHPPLLRPILDSIAKMTYKVDSSKIKKAPLPQPLKDSLLKDSTARKDSIKHKADTTVKKDSTVKSKKDSLAPRKKIIKKSTRLKEV